MYVFVVFQYVKQTTRRLRDCLYDDSYDIEKDPSTNVTQHFNNCHAGGTSAVTQIVKRVRISKRGGDVF